MVIPWQANEDDKEFEDSEMRQIIRVIHQLSKVGVLLFLIFRLIHYKKLFYGPC